MKKIINTLLLLGLFVVMTGCHENDGSGVISTLPNENLAPNNTGMGMVANPINPYDNYGELCNGGLLHFFNNATYNGTDTEALKNEFQNLQTNYLVNINPDNIPPNEAEQYYRNIAEENWNICWENVPLATDNFSLQIEDILSDTVYFTPSGIQDFLVRIKAIENGILQSSLPNKTALLKATAVFRYNTYFILNYCSDASSVVYSYFNDNPLTMATLENIADSHNYPPMFHIGWMNKNYYDKVGAYAFYSLLLWYYECYTGNPEGYTLGQLIMISQFGF